MPFNPRRFLILNPERKRLFHLDFRFPHVFQPRGHFRSVHVEHGETSEMFGVFAMELP